MTLSTKLSAALFCTALFSIQTAMADGDGKHEHDSKMAQPSGAVAATVNGKPIAKMVADRVKEQLSANGQPANEKQILDELINLEILTQAAEKIKLNQKDEVAAALHLQYTQTMSNAYLGEYSKNLKIEEAAIRAEYDKQVAGRRSGCRRYHCSAKCRWRLCQTG